MRIYLIETALLNLRDIDLGEIRTQLGPNRRKSGRFLLGFWRKEDPD